MRNYINYLSSFRALGLLFILSAQWVMAADLSQYLLTSVNSDHYYYNFQHKDQSLYIGSDNGILLYQDPLNLRHVDTTKKGYISSEKGVLISSNYLKGNLFTPHYKNLLPEGFRHNSIVGTEYKNQLLIISKGQLFVYKKTIKPKADTLSIRSISSHYLGTYGGVFYNGKRFNYPNYANGYIREYPEETFICYDGLLRIRGKDTIRYEANGGNALVGQTDIGKIIDIFRIDSKRYLLLSDKGISLSDLNSNPQWIEQKNTGIEPRIIKAYYRDELPIVIFYIYGNKIRKYNLLNNSSTTLFQIDPAEGNIEDAYVKDAGTIYLVTSKKLIEATSNALGIKYIFTTLADNHVGNHHIFNLNNLLLITSNDGLSTYNLDSREWIPYLIRDEFNQRAFFVLDGVYFLGTIHGYYQLSQAQIEQLISQRKEEIKDAVPENVSNSTNDTLIYGLVAICLTLIGTSIYFFTRNGRIGEQVKAKPNEIIDYIESNLKDVTIVNICHEFKINPLQLNDILGNDKPGELIRAKRLEIVKKMRKDRRREEDIALVTGFSVSYLKKIKT
jgi:hypothetical protein